MLKKAQRPVDVAVDELAYILNVHRPELHINQAVKGEACGHFTIPEYDFNTKSGCAIPADLSDMNPTRMPKWVLLVEKYAIYDRLVSSGYTQDKPCLLVTGRGNFALGDRVGNFPTSWKSSRLSRYFLTSRKMNKLEFWNEISRNLLIVEQI